MTKEDIIQDEIARTKGNAIAINSKELTLQDKGNFETPFYIRYTPEAHAVHGQVYAECYEGLELYLNFYIKFDGCCHFNFGDTNGYLHICGAESVAVHVWLLSYLMKLSSEEMHKIESSGLDWDYDTYRKDMDLLLKD